MTRRQRRAGRSPSIRTEFQKSTANLSADRQQRTGVTPERMLRDIDTAANLDSAELFDDQTKRLKSVHDMPLHVRRTIVSVEVVRRNLTAGDGMQEYVY